MDLNLPPCALNIKSIEGKDYVFDEIRKKWVVLNPEEYVRQHLIHFLIDFKNYPKSLLAVEQMLKYNQLEKRADILAYNKSGKIDLLVEVKAPHVNLDEKVLSQIATYHKSLQAKYLLISNGMEHYCIGFNSDGGFSFLDDIPTAEK